MVRAIEKFHAEHGTPHALRRAAVVLGAEHMVAVSRGLRKLGYRPIEKEWITIIEPNDLQS